MIKKLVSLRHEQKKSKVDVAGAIGVSVVTLWKYENEKTGVPVANLVKWAGELGYDVVLVPKTIKL